MRQSSIFRRLIPAAAIVLMTLFITSCASTNQKYGCPNHMNSGVALK